jgi:hypothetical protein
MEKGLKTGRKRNSQAQWFMPLILDTQEQKSSGLVFYDSPGKTFRDPISTNKS